jgi:nucleotide-binding universal stress UspA family protein
VARLRVVAGQGSVRLAVAACAMHGRIAVMASRRYRIVVALDGSEFSQIVLENAFDQAARHESPDVHLITVAADASVIDFTKRWLARTALECLDSFSAHRGSWRTRLHVCAGNVEDEIANLVNDIDADMLVLGNYGIHPQRKPIVTRIVERISCATLVVGLTGHAVEAHPQCPACVDVREASDGERWFCDAHTSDHELHLSTLVISGGVPSVHGGW